MAGPESANQTAHAAAAEAGSDAADSIAVSCDLVRLGVFFDGTGNSRNHIDQGDVSWHTNVDLLEHVYQETAAPERREILGQVRDVNYGKEYFRGIGVNADGSNNTNGRVRGMGPEGVRQRVDQAIDRLQGVIRRKAGGMEVCDLWFDVFGFSRGAAAARHFANQVEADRLGIQEATARVKFLGLFDTVVMIGLGVDTRGADDNVNVRTANVADKIVHITANDEIRQNFPLTLASSETRYRMVGAHSDIGGGYSPNDPDDRGGNFAFEHEDYPGLPDYLATNWGMSGTTSAVDASSPDTLVQERQNFTQPWDRGEAFSTFTWTALHGLQFVSLKVMYDEAVRHNVPFEAWTNNIAGTDVTMSDTLAAYHQALMTNRNSVRPEQERAVRLRYAHASFNGLRDTGVRPALPRENGTRQTDRQ